MQETCDIGTETTGIDPVVINIFSMLFHSNDEVVHGFDLFRGPRFSFCLDTLQSSAMFAQVVKKYVPRRRSQGLLCDAEDRHEFPVLYSVFYGSSTYWTTL